MENVLILGARGMLGGQLLSCFSSPIGWDKDDVDVTDLPAVKSKILSLPSLPEAIINCVAYNDVDGAESKPGLAYKLNAEAVGGLAALAKSLGVPLVHFSTNYVFDGKKGQYSEDDEPSPLSVYGASKAVGEKALAENAEKYYLIRTAVLFGPKGQSEASKKSFVDIMLQLSEQGGPIKAVADEINSLTYAKDLAVAVRSLLSGGYPYGTYHIVNSGEASWYEYAREIFAAAGKPADLYPVPASDFPRAAKRPARAVLINKKYEPLRAWQESLKEFLAERN